MNENAIIEEYVTVNEEYFDSEESNVSSKSGKIWEWHALTAALGVARDNWVIDTFGEHSFYGTCIKLYECI